MKQEEYKETIVYNGHMINLGIDDYGQQYFIEFVNDAGKLVELGCGAYNSDYQHEIEYLFGEPEKCPYLQEVEQCCERAYSYGYCSRCQYHPFMVRQRHRQMLMKDASGAVCKKQ